jgi:hypothetical protein
VLLPALRAVVDADVTLTFTVTNTSIVPVTLDFNNGQQYDFIVRSNSSGSLVWQWSSEMMFAAMLTARTLGPGESVVYVERWKPATMGAFSAQALLTSRSHSATAFTSFTVR